MEPVHHRIHSYRRLAKDAAYFTTGALVISGLALPLILAHTEVVSSWLSEVFFVLFFVAFVLISEYARVACTQVSRSLLRNRARRSSHYTLGLSHSCLPSGMPLSLSLSLSLYVCMSTRMHADLAGTHDHVPVRWPTCVWSDSGTCITYHRTKSSSTVHIANDPDTLLVHPLLTLSLVPCSTGVPENLPRQRRG
jgi:Vacuolar protein sorting 55